MVKRINNNILYFICDGDSYNNSVVSYKKKYQIQISRDYFRICIGKILIYKPFTNPVHKLLISIPPKMFSVETIRYVCENIRFSMPGVSPGGRSKGNPVKVGNYPRSCKFLPKAAQTRMPLSVYPMGRRATRNKSEDLPDELHCSFRVKSDRMSGPSVRGPISFILPELPFYLIV